MKKIKFINVLLVLVLVCGIFFLTSCNEKTDFWTSTNTKIETFTTNEANQFLFSDDNVLTYSVGIEEQIENNNEKYSQLNTGYFSIVNNLMLMFKTHYSNLLIIAPKTQNNTAKSYYSDFDNKLEEMQNGIDEFLTNKAYFENHITTNYESDASLQELTIFKRKFVDFINIVINFNKSFENLYTYSYLSIPTSEITTVPTGLENLIATTTTNKILRSYVVFIFDDENGLIPDNIDTNPMEKIEEIQTALKNPTYKADSFTLINNLLPYTKAFDNELSNYYLALNNVNMKEVREQGIITYKNTYKDKVTYIENIQRFNDNSINIYVEKVLELIA